LGRQSLVLVGAVLLLLEAVAACGGSSGSGGPGVGAGKVAATSHGASPAPARAHARFDEEIELADGRRVGMYYAAGRGLLEQHRKAGGGAWSEPHLVYRTASDPCQGVTLKAFDGTVAVMADWGTYCADGEPPTESLAAVGTGSLSRWDTKLTKDFDGWEKVATVDDTRHLRFTRTSTEWLTRLRWSQGEGFAAVEEIRR
jgi:hypothetical protein